MSRHITEEAIFAAVAGAIAPLLQSQHKGTSDRQQLSVSGDGNRCCFLSDGFVMSLLILVLSSSSSKGGKMQNAETIMSYERDIVCLPKSYYLRVR